MRKWVFGNEQEERVGKEQREEVGIAFLSHKNHALV